MRVVILLLLFFLPLTLSAQSCPEFELLSIQKENDNFKVEIKIDNTSTNLETNDFSIWQGKESVKGSLTEDVSLEIQSNKLIIKGLSSSEKLLFGQYLVLYYNEKCSRTEELVVAEFKTN